MTGKWLLVCMVVICLPAASGAWTVEFANDYASANAIYLWMNTVNTGSTQVTFSNTTFKGGHADWKLVVNEPFRQFMAGPPKPAFTSGIVVDFSSKAPFSFQWAEVQWHGSQYTLLGSGTGRWSGSGWNFSDPTFTHTGDIVAVPIPPAAFLMGTGILGLLLIGLGRRKGGANLKS